MMIRGTEVGEGMARGAPGKGLPPWIIKVHEVAEEIAGVGPGKGGVPP